MKTIPAGTYVKHSKYGFGQVVGPSHMTDAVVVKYSGILSKVNGCKVSKIEDLSRVVSGKRR